MSTTPRTDAEVSAKKIAMEPIDWELVGLARQLEADLAAALDTAREESAKDMAEMRRLQGDRIRMAQQLSAVRVTFETIRDTAIAIRDSIGRRARTVIENEGPDRIRDRACRAIDALDAAKETKP